MVQSGGGSDAASADGRPPSTGNNVQAPSDNLRSRPQASADSAAQRSQLSWATDA